jgi:hypothetical protein
MGFLRGAGYTLLDDWTWRPPSDNPRYEAFTGPSAMERDAITYLIEEWDFGGLEE